MKVGAIVDITEQTTSGWTITSVEDGVTFVKRFDDAWTFQGAERINEEAGATFIQHFNSAWSFTGADKVSVAAGTTTVETFGYDWRFQRATVSSTLDGFVTKQQFGSDWAFAGATVSEVNGDTTTTRYFDADWQFNAAQLDVRSQDVVTTQVFDSNWTAIAWRASADVGESIQGVSSSVKSAFVYADNFNFGSQADDVIIGGVHHGIAPLFSFGGSGGDGNDILVASGTSSHNWLTGGAGDDVFVVGNGLTDMTGGAGRDIFTFTPSSHFGLIRDFTSGEDLIDLRAFHLENFEAVIAATRLDPYPRARIHLGGTYDDAGEIAVVLEGISLGALTPQDFLL